MADYVDKKEFLDLILEYKQTKNKQVYNKIGKYFVLIAENFLNRPSLINYSRDRKDEFVSDATYIMCKYINSFDETKNNNAFGYFSRMVENSFKQTLNKHKKNNSRYVALSFIDNFDINVEFIDQDVL